jgi:hypothetical protein
LNHHSLINKAGKDLISIAVIILGAMSMMAPADVVASEFRIRPGIVLSEEYSDNVLLTTENRYDDYLTRIAPSLSVSYLAPRWDWDIAYDYQYRYYGRKTLDDESTHALRLVNKNRIVKDALLLDIQDNYERVSLDVTRDYTQESNYANQSDRNLFTVNPHVVLEPLSRMTVTAGYIYLNTWYKDPSAVDSKDHIGYVDLRHDLSLRSAITVGARRTWDENRVEGYTQDELSLGLFHEFGAGSTITAKAGNIWFDYERTDRTSQVFWDAVLMQRWPSVTVSYETGLRFIADPQGGLRREDRYLATVRKEVERTSFAVSGGMREYRDAVYKHLERTSYLVNGSVSHAITTKSKILLDLTSDRLRENPSSAVTDRILTGVRFEYRAREKLTLALDYRYTDVYTPDVYLTNYYSNRFTMELRKVF